MPPGDLAVIGEQQQAFGIEIQPAHRHHAAQMLGQAGEDGGAALFVLVGGDQARRLVIAPQPRGFGLRPAACRPPGRHCSAVTLMAGEVTSSPSSFTRPSAISFSASRREQMPARAMTFAMRSPSGNAQLLNSMNDGEAIALALEEAKAARHAGRSAGGRGAAGGRWRAAGAGRQPHPGAARIPPPMPRCWCCGRARKALGNERLTGTHAVCVAGALRHVRRAPSRWRGWRGWCSRPDDPKGGAVLHGPRFFEQPTCHHRPVVAQSRSACGGSGRDIEGFLPREAK